MTCLCTVELWHNLRSSGCTVEAAAMENGSSGWVERSGRGISTHIKIEITSTRSPWNRAFAEDRGRHVGLGKKLPMLSKNAAPAVVVIFSSPARVQSKYPKGIKPTWPRNNALTCPMRAPQIKGHLQRARESLACIRKGNDCQGLGPILTGITGKVPTGCRNRTEKVAVQRVSDNKG